MKHRDLIKLLEADGWRLKRGKGGHDVYVKPGFPRPVPVGRHREIKDLDAEDILKEAGIKR